MPPPDVFNGRLNHRRSLEQPVLRQVIVEDHTPPTPNSPEFAGIGSAEVPAYADQALPTASADLSVENGGEYTMEETEEALRSQPPSNEKEVLIRKLKAVFFIEMKLTPEHVANIASPDGRGVDYITFRDITLATNLTQRLQRGMFGSKDMTRYAVQMMRDYNAMKDDEQPDFRDLTAEQQKGEFRNRYTVPMIKTMLMPLRTTIDIPRVFKNRTLAGYVQSLFVTTCMTIARDTKFSMFDIATGLPFSDSNQLYTNIREVPNRFQLPRWQDIPVPSVTDGTEEQLVAAPARGE
ncbi:hypothetical protein DM02DRAFT_623918 [Periconia macrospinosa]|uniref:Uncharacterized protein n=1 Tax=Periconia macrospinosa TaxID=97972 RepID=A0A2V1E4L5_9PLEO|nr:hypothetical protein DM02DRAFT_623918 [Periconia macrospinosa]